MPHPLIYFYPQQHQAHALPGHPERPERIDAIVKALQDLSLWTQYPHLPPVQVPPEVLASVHSQNLLDLLASTHGKGGMIDADTYLTPHSWELALQAAGGACALAGTVWDGGAARGFALCRPPGHHATPTRAMGFCLLNNIALAAEYLFQVHGARRLAIVDIDLHHGNGTQDIFYHREDVLFISAHQHPLYPGTGAAKETGSGSGEGSTANIPLPPYSGDTAYASLADQLLFPLLERFAPEMILVSAGMDAHWRDPLGHLLLSAKGYGDLVGGLVDFAEMHCQGRLALILEGGYDLEGGSACAAAAASALLDHSFEDPVGPSPQKESDSWRDVVRRVRAIHSL